MNVRRCLHPDCKAEIVFLVSKRTGARVPVDYESLTEDDLSEESFGNEPEFDPARHVSHFKTCKDPDYFSRLKKQGPKDTGR